MQIKCKLRLEQFQREYSKAIDKTFEANKEYMDNLSLHFDFSPG